MNLLQKIAFTFVCIASFASCLYMGIMYTVIKVILVI
jgi:hypothetical protein